MGGNAKLVFSQVPQLGQQNDEGAWNSWEISAISYPDKNEYDGGLGPFWNFCQESTCGSCGMEIRSNAKKAFCSICGCANGLS